MARQAALIFEAPNTTTATQVEVTIRFVGDLDGYEDWEYEDYAGEIADTCVDAFEGNRHFFNRHGPIKVHVQTRPELCFDAESGGDDDG